MKLNGAVYAYDRYVFYNNTIDDNMVYILEDNESLKNKLIEKGFKNEKFNENICILYKE